jgi:hypothetical protein
MIDLTSRARAASQATNVIPNLVFGIDGYENVFGALSILRIIRIGDPDLYIGGGWVIGGLTEDPNTRPFVSMSLGGGATTSKISQQVAPDKAQGISVTSMVVQVLDKGELGSRLISPGVLLEDVMGRDAFVRIGFKDTAYPEDYDVVFRGIIQDIQSGPGYVNFQLAGTEEKKRRPVFAARTWPLSATMDATQTTLSLTEPSLFAVAVNGPNGTPDSTLNYFVRVDDEIMKYTGRGTASLTGLTRAQNGTVADSHDEDTEVESLYHLTGNPMDIALKIMLSGWNGPFISGVDVSAVNQIAPTENVANSLFFEGVDIEKEYGLVSGDYVTVTGSGSGGNNVTLKQISSVVKTNLGSYLVITGVTFVTELNSPATVAFRSKYDTYGQGLKFKPSEIDVAEHERIKSIYLSAFEMDFWIDDIPAAKDWIEQELYLPCACFSIFRSGRSSVAIHVGPLTSTTITELNRSNVINPQNLKLARSLTTNFTNTVRYHFNYNIVTNKFATIRAYESTVSKERIPIGDKVFEVKSKGLTSANVADTLSENSALKFLGRYEFGAEYIKGIKLLFKDGYPLEIGDIVLVDHKDLQITDTSTGNRRGTKKLYEVLNKTFDIATGDVQIDIVATQFSTGQAFALIAPASEIGPSAGTESIPLKKSFGTQAFESESRKWINFIGSAVLVRAPDFSYSEETTIDNILISGDDTTMVVDPPLGIPPGEDWIIEPVNYSDSTNASLNLAWKTNFAFQSPRVAITAGVSQLIFEVDPADIDKFLVGATVLVHNELFTDVAPEAEVTNVNTGTNRVTIDTATGFTINSTHLVSLIGFADGGQSYRWL